MVSVMGFDFPNDFGKSNPIYANKILFVFVGVNSPPMIRTL